MRSPTTSKSSRASPLRPASGAPGTVSVMVMPRSSPPQQPLTRGCRLSSWRRASWWAWMGRGTRLSGSFLWKDRRIACQGIRLSPWLDLEGVVRPLLPNQVYNKIKFQFDWAEFVSVSQNPDINKILEGIHSSAGPDCRKNIS